MKTLNPGDRHIRGAAVGSMLLAVTLLAGCAQPQARVSGEWKEGASGKQSFSRVLIVGVSPDLNQRCTFESFMAAQIKSESTAAITSCDAMAQREPLTREGVEQAAVAQRADAVLATFLVAGTGKIEAKEGGSRDTRGSGAYKATDIGYGGFYGAYGAYGAYGIPVVYADFVATPSIMVASGEVNVTSRLFETGGATLVYTLETKAHDLQSRADAMLAITTPIGERLRREGLIR